MTLTREIPTLKTVVVKAGLTATDFGVSDNVTFAALLCTDDSKVISDEHFVFFNQMMDAGDAATYTTNSDDDEEAVEVDLNRVPAEVARIVFVAWLNTGVAQRRSLGQLRKAVVRVCNGDGDAELLKSEDFATSLGSETALVLAELYRHREHWKFRVVGAGYTTGLAGVARDYGLNL